MLPKDPQKAEEYRKKLSDIHKGIKLSFATIEKMRNSALKRKKKSRGQRKGFKHSEESKARLRATWAKRKQLGVKLSYSRYFAENNPNKGKFGKEHPCWKENKKHPFQKLIRETYKYKEWRTAIFKRNNYTCVLCGNGNGIFVEADHFPIRFIDIIRKFEINTLDKAIACEPLWDTNNGRTLCRECHRKTDTWGRRKD